VNSNAVLLAVVWCSATLLLVAGCDGPADGGAAQRSVPSGAAARDAAKPADAASALDAVNLRLLGHDDLQARSAYQPIVHAYGERRILFVGHHAGEAMNPLTGKMEKNGLSILDVTNPAAPKYLAHVPPTGPEASGTQHVQVCDGSALPRGDAAKVYAIRTNGQLSYELLDVTDPARPSFLRTIAETGVSSRPASQRGNRETHKFQWDCATGIAYLNGTAPGWRVTRVLQAFDVGDPAAPRHIRDFGLAGYEPGGPPYPEPQVAGLHQPFVVGNRIYLGYNSGDEGVLQIVDRDKFLLGREPGYSSTAVTQPEIAAAPVAPTPDNLLFPQIARLDFPRYYGVHTAKPILGVDVADYADNRDARTRDLLLVSSEEETFRCQTNRDVMFILDITDERHPLPISTFQVPEEPGDFCHRGGRFGPHSFADAYNPAFDKKLVVLAYFNAGIRVVDIRDPFRPVEVARFVPEIAANTTESCIEIDGVRECKRAIQTNNVNLDDRGYIYALDRASTGLHILELTGAARAIANGK
jgi:hypothetical protein